MSAITPNQTNYVDAACQTMSFDEIVEQAVKEKQRLNDRVVEELKPLCEELPERLIDPVTLEPIENPGILRCSHVFGITTIKNCALSKRLKIDDPFPCPTCRTETWGKAIIRDVILGTAIHHIKKIKGVFENYAAQETRTEDCPKKKKTRVE